MPLTLTEAITDSVGITDSLTGHLVFPRAFTDTVGVTDSLARKIVFNRAFTDTVGITDTLTRKITFRRTVSDTVGITDVLRKNPTAKFNDVVGITDVLTVGGKFIQYDTWRPIPQPGTHLVLVCRTPEGTHDTTASYPYMTFWTVKTDGSNERPAIRLPSENGHGWTAFYHPEWSPDGTQIVMVTETSTKCKLTILNASGFGQ